MEKNTSYIFTWILKITAILILGQSLVFKFSGHPESVQLFTEMRMEPYGRYLIGLLELGVILLLIKRATDRWGAILGVGVMTGAIVSHFTQLGWTGERGILGIMAVVVFIACAAIVYIRRTEIIFSSVVLRQKDF